MLKYNYYDIELINVLMLILKLLCYFNVEKLDMNSFSLEHNI